MGSVEGQIFSASRLAAWDRVGYYVKWISRLPIRRQQTAEFASVWCLWMDECKCKW